MLAENGPTPWRRFSPIGASKILLLFRNCLLITVPLPGETESGSAGTQPDKG
jgi:hypothetical protein